MEELTDEEVEFLKRSIVLIETKQVTGILEDLVKRQLDLISTSIGKDKELRESILWNIAALCSAIMQLRPGGWALEDLEFSPIQVEIPEEKSETEEGN
jgi:hypothetical protein